MKPKDLSVPEVSDAGTVPSVASMVPQVRIESSHLGYVSHAPLHLYRVIANFNGIELRGNEYSSRIAAVVDAKKAFPGWEDR